MSDVMPYFKFHYVDISGRRTLCIETGGRVLHEVINLPEFYEVFGYRAKSGDADQLPDEFIWSEYTNNPLVDLSSCVQVLILKYLKQHSPGFEEEFGEHYQTWIAEHEKFRTQNGINCIACSSNAEKKC
jgi:hypothetical protein